MTQFTEAQQDKLYDFFAKYVYCELRGVDDPSYYSDHWKSSDGTKTSMLKNMRKMGLPLVSKLVNAGYLEIKNVGAWVIYVETDKFAELMETFSGKSSADAWTANREEIAGWEQLVADGTVIYEKHTPLVIMW